MADPYKWRRMGHIPMLIILQIVFIILFAQFVVYDEHSAIKNIHFDKNHMKHMKKDALATMEKPKTDEEMEQNGTGPKHEKLVDEEEELHITTRDAKEILTDYPSKYVFIRYHYDNAN